MKEITGIALTVCCALLGIGSAFGQTQPVTPGFAAAITKQISPIVVGDHALIQLTTVNTYPYYVHLLSVQATNGSPAPDSWGENVSTQACPSQSSAVPGGVACRQYFEIYWPYSTCMYHNTTAQLVFGYTMPGQPNQTVNIVLNSENWCSEYNVTSNSFPAPQITGMNVGSVQRGHDFELDVFGSYLNLVSNPSNLRVYLNGAWLQPSAPQTMQNPLPPVMPNELRVIVPGSMTLNQEGPIQIKVQTDGGASNILLLNVTQ